ncbi:MAG: hypothetical protein LBS36_10275 [Oscillospiraceae bacterium]|nr:hypothetical protein [Oscillospiraceae bacterium]
MIDANGNKITDPSHIGNVNPIRYRGYYYDTETGYYYLQSRYYNPEWGRFLNADALFAAGNNLTGTNMFAYCLNNPVMFCDPSGYNNEGVIDHGNDSDIWKSLFGIFAFFTLFQEQFTNFFNQIATFFSSISIGSSTASIPSDLGRIARKYGNLKCVEAATDMQEYLIKNKLHGYAISLVFPTMSYVESISKNKIISENGIHVGILYNGIVYCNVHPTGLPEQVWINDFADAAYNKPTVTKIYI